jgi:hypothetical protein
LIKPNRKSLLIIMLISFVAMTTGFSIFLHLHNVKHQEHNSHNECVICQNSLLSSQKAIIESETTIKNIELNSHYVQFFTQEEKTTTKFLLPLLRAPPYVC